MSEDAAAFAVPENWREIAREVATQEAVPVDALLGEVHSATIGEPHDFAEGWADLVLALGDSLQGLAHTPALAAAFLRAEWLELSRLAEAMEGEPPPEEAAERFRLAAEAASSPARVLAIAASLRRAAAEIRAAGDLAALLGFEWYEGYVEPSAAEAAPNELPASGAAEPRSEPAAEPAPAPPPAPETVSAPVLEAPRPRSAGEPDISNVPGTPATPSLLVLARPSLRRQFLERQLASTGFSVECADNSREAVHRLSSGRYHAVLVDPDLTFTDLGSWAEHAGATRVLRLEAGGPLAGAAEDREVFATPPSEDEIERLRRSL